MDVTKAQLPKERGCGSAVLCYLTIGSRVIQMLVLEMSTVCAMSLGMPVSCYY